MKFLNTMTLGIVNVLVGGALTLAGVLISSALTRRREHARWALENRKIEYRQLIDELHKCIAKMSNAFVVIASLPGEDPHSAYADGLDLIENRIFTADSMKQFGIKDHWSDLGRLMELNALPEEKGKPLYRIFWKKAAEFEENLVKAARKDLKIE